MKNRNVLILLIAISILLLVLMISSLVDGLNLNDDEKIDIIEDRKVENYKISKSDQEIIDKYSPYMENIYTKSLSVEKLKKLTQIIDEIIENLNQRNYSALYDKLETTYLECQFSSEKDFEEFIKATLLDGRDYICKFYDAKYHGFECAITSETQDKSFRLKIIPTETFDDYNLTFRPDIVTAEKKNIYFSAVSLFGEILYEFKCTDTLEFVVALKNNTNQTIKVSLDGSDVETNYRGSIINYKLIAPSDEITFKPKEEKNVILVFDIKATESIRPSHMNFECNVNGEKYTSRVKIDVSDLDTPS